jgi:hypothetical protein
MGGNEQLRWLLHDIVLSVLYGRAAALQGKNGLVVLKGAGLN